MGFTGNYIYYLQFGIVNSEGIERLWDGVMSCGWIENDRAVILWWEKRMADAKPRHFWTKQTFNRDNFSVLLHRRHSHFYFFCFFWVFHRQKMFWHHGQANQPVDKIGKGVINNAALRNSKTLCFYNDSHYKKATIVRKIPIWCSCFFDLVTSCFNLAENPSSLLFYKCMIHPALNPPTLTRGFFHPFPTKGQWTRYLTSISFYPNLLKRGNKEWGLFKTDLSLFDNKAFVHGFAVLANPHKIDATI